MKNKVIGVDMDEVLAELLDMVLEYNDYKIGKEQIKREDVKDYYIHKLSHLGITKEEAISWFRTPMYEDMEKCLMKRVPGSLERLIELKKDGNKLIIVTARIKEIFGKYTIKWIDIHFPDIFDEIVFADHFTEKSRKKSEVCKELGIEFMIEDNYNYALDLAKNGIKTYLLEKPWNDYILENHENIIRVSSWENIGK